MFLPPSRTSSSIRFLSSLIGIENASTILRNSIPELPNQKVTPKTNALNPMLRRSHPFCLLGLLIVFLARVPNANCQQMHIVDSQINQNIDSLLARMRAPAADIYAGLKKVPLKEALARWDVRVLLDEQAFEDEAISVDELVEAPFHGQSMLSFLELNVRAQLNLTWVPHEGGIRITTRYNNANMLCAWDISRLSKPKLDTLRRATPSNGNIGSQWIQLIHSTIENDSWDIAGGTATLVELQMDNKTILVASAPFETNMKIHDLLNSLDTISNHPAMKHRTGNLSYSEHSARTSRHPAHRQRAARHSSQSR